MSWLSGIIKNVAPLASLIPGPWGKIAGVVGGAMAAGDAAKQAKEYGKGADAQLAFQKLLQEEALKNYRANEASGAYDPAKKIDLLHQNFQKLLGQGTGLVSGNASAYGYKPGDSPVFDKIQALESRDALRFANQAQGLTDQARESKMADLGRVAGMSNPLGAAAMYGNFANNARPDTVGLQKILGGFGAPAGNPGNPGQTLTMQPGPPVGRPPGGGQGGTQLPVGFDFGRTPGGLAPNTGLDPTLKKKFNLPTFALS